MTEAEALEQSLTDCRLLACKCSWCYRKPVLIYRAGVTIARCRCAKFALPDWCPRDMLRLWNRMQLQDDRSAENTQRIINQQIEKMK